MIVPKYNQLEHPEVSSHRWGQPIIIDESQYIPDDRYYPHTIAEDNHRVWTMNLRSCDRWLERYKGDVQHPTPKSKPKLAPGETRVKLGPLRAMVTARQRHLKNAHSAMEFARDLHESILQFHSAICCHLERTSGRSPYGPSPYLPKRSNRKFASNGRNVIFDMPAIPLGLITESAYERKLANAKYKTTNEHCLPRTVGMKQIVDWAQAMRQQDDAWFPTPREITQLCLSASFVVWATKEENEKALKPYQSVSTFPGCCESYQCANIGLVRVAEMAIPYMCLYVMDIDDISIDELNVPDFSAITIQEDQYLPKPQLVLVK